jgi:hypothetical protein
MNEIKIKAHKFVKKWGEGVIFKNIFKLNLIHKKIIRSNPIFREMLIFALMKILL